MTAVLVAVMVIFYSLQSLFCKLFSEHYKSHDAALASTVFSIVYGVFTGAATLAVALFRFAPSRVTVIYGVINAVMLLVYNTAMIQASRCGSYSFQMICTLFGIVLVPMAIGAIVLGEALSALQFFAIGLMLVSFVLMNLKGLSFKGLSRRFLFWCLTLFLSNGFYAQVMNLQQTAMSGAERNEMIVITSLGMAVLYAAIQTVRDRGALAAGFRRIDRTSLVFLLLCCASATAGVHMIFYILSLIDQTVVYTIDSGGVLVLSVLYSRFIFHEQLDRTQLIGIALATASIVMLSL